MALCGMSYDRQTAFGSRCFPTQYPIQLYVHYLIVEQSKAEQGRAGQARPGHALSMMDEMGRYFEEPLDNFGNL